MEIINFYYLFDSSCIAVHFPLQITDDIIFIIVCLSFLGKYTKIDNPNSPFYVFKIIIVFKVKTQRKHLQNKTYIEWTH